MIMKLEWRQIDIIIVLLILLFIYLCFITNIIEGYSDGQCRSRCRDGRYMESQAEVEKIKTERNTFKNDLDTTKNQLSTLKNVNQNELWSRFDAYIPDIKYADELKICVDKKRNEEGKFTNLELLDCKDKIQTMLEKNTSKIAIFNEKQSDLKDLFDNEFNSLTNSMDMITS